MLKGIYLTLLIGPAVPIPAPQFVTDALSSIQVNASKERSGFQLTFSVAKNSILLTTLLPAGFFDPIITRVIVIATLNGVPNVLMDGLVTNQELTPSNDPGQTTLVISGEDLSIAMDLVEKVIPYPGFTEIAQVYTALAPYALLGIIPLVIPPIIPSNEIVTSKWFTQHSTDRSFIKKLARRCGYVFFVQPGPLPGQSIAYFGPDISLPIPQPALSINFDAQTNVENISFSLDGLAKETSIFNIFTPTENGIVPIPIPVPNINPFKPPLGLRPTPTVKVNYADSSTKLTASESAQQILGYLLTSAPAVTASGSLDVMRYNNILHARLLVSVRGAGLTYDGMYYVDSVTHNIKPGEYKQNFTLSRDGLISNTPKVLA
jgi:hypothetical protein